ncbi:hypothetical protein COV93_07600 [Candidatus Woesearchaeota archaeon CG11_big_fil_rev_8_21_14_0_20_43_8]|nr:MAG: hypothetical protein COV93_07600 [Candidatus Woesearchaeota archaeon CG11_big_fil_rev_8_21_14_0_20_43_8]
MKSIITIKKKAEMGVGVLIIFIAMLLVAAIAAGVLITTVTSLQQKALTTGQETRGEISTHSNFIEVSATDGQDGDLENLSFIMRLAAGSDPIDLNDVLLTISLNNMTGNLRYDPASDPSTTTFNVTYQVTGTENRDGFLVRGDVVEVDCIPPRDLIEDESVRITFIPKIGTQSIVEFRSPSVISRQDMVLFP